MGRQRGTPEGLGLPPGSPAPDARVEDADGHPVQLGRLYGSGPILLVFYRGGWCPYCNVQIRDLTAAYPEFRRRGVTPVAVSADRPQAASKTRAEYHIPFPVLSDPDLAAHEAFRVVHQAGPEEVAKLKGYGLDIDAALTVAYFSFVNRVVLLLGVEVEDDYERTC